jgi:hypothetical protein
VNERCAAPSFTAQRCEFMDRTRVFLHCLDSNFDSKELRSQAPFRSRRPYSVPAAVTQQRLQRLYVLE